MEFFDAVPSDLSDESALHQFRIRGKELRYGVELLAGAFPERLRTELYPAVEAMQDRLGEMNDMAVAKARLQHQIETAGRTSETAGWRRLLAGEEKQLDRAKKAFWEGCTLHDLQYLRAGFESLLALQDPSSPSRNGQSPALASAPVSRSSPDRLRIEERFAISQKDRTKAFELKQELDRLGVFKDYEDRFLDLFRKSS
jgi:hypothetical protein